MANEIENKEVIEEQAAQAAETVETVAAPVEEPAAEPVAEPVAAPAKRKSNASADNATFDWDAFENDGFDEADKTATEESYSQTLSRVSENLAVH